MPDTYEPSEGVKQILGEYAVMLDGISDSVTDDPDERLRRTYSKRLTVVTAIADESGMSLDEASAWIFRQLAGPWAEQDD